MPAHPKSSSPGERQVCIPNPWGKQEDTALRLPDLNPTAIQFEGVKGFYRVLLQLGD